MRLRILLLSLILFPFLSQATPVKISGVAPGAEGKRIELITISDFISLTEKISTYGMIDSLGAFALTIDLDQTVYAILSIDFHRAELFLQPAQNYSIKIARMDYKELQDVNPFIQSAKLDVSFESFNPDDINSLIGDFSVKYNDFLLKNFNALYRDRNRAILDTFMTHTHAAYAKVTDVYFKNYITYKLASLVQLTQSMNQAQIGKRYFADAPILYQNIEYMDFFNEYFSKYLTATSRALKFIDYKTILDSQDPYKGMMKALEADTILRKVQLRELVLLKGLLEMYNSPNYEKGKVLVVMKAIQENTKFPENKVVANGIVHMLTKLLPGSPAPDFKLLALGQKEVTMADFRGKLVVLNFWTTYCQGCISEMDKMKSLYDKYKDRVNFVSISADKDYWKTDYFISLKKDFVWNFLHIGTDYNLIKEYDVRSYPLFVIIDQDGKILQCPADLPSNGLDVALQKLLN